MAAPAVVAGGHQAARRGAGQGPLAPAPGLWGPEARAGPCLDTLGLGVAECVEFPHL
jgi:hypothetical protein